MSDTDIEQARLRALSAKMRLSATLAVLKQRLLPSTIARNLVQAGTDKAADAANAGADAVRARPGIALGAAALAAFLLVRKPISRAFSSDPPETLPIRPRSRRKSVRKAAE